MNSYLSELTIVIVTYRTDIEILKNCIDSINKEVKITIIENSNNFKHTNEIKDKYNNIKIYCTGSNLGMGAGNNYGLKKVNTKYALVLNPDTVCGKNFFPTINKYLNGDIDFALIGGAYKGNENFKPAGFFDGKDLKFAKYINDFNLCEVDWIVGHTILFNMEKFNNKIFFDENYFLFFEETDLCMRVKRIGEKVFMCPDLIIDHLGWKGSFAINKEYEIDSIKLRNWHYMWSYFYYHKKNYSYIYSLKKSLGRFFRSIIRIFYYSLTFDKKNKTIYTYRLFGLINSIFLKKSNFRINFKD
tara:strand:+ start:192 stop:1094 length:903 start_codon:yes stop_codon:yes gene_type:complete